MVHFDQRFVGQLLRARVTATACDAPVLIPLSCETMEQGTWPPEMLADPPYTASTRDVTDLMRDLKRAHRPGRGARSYTSRVVKVQSANNPRVVIKTLQIVPPVPAGRLTLIRRPRGISCAPSAGG